MSDRVPAEIRVAIRDDSDLVVARRQIRELASLQGFGQVAIEELATAVTEIARNIVIHAGTGEIVVAPAARGGQRGVIVTALDAGPGILHIDQAMQDGFSTTGSLGCGLSGARRLVDELEIESIVGVGSRVTLRKWTGR
jgi:serine/threonine-protein kinase RsbT